MNRPFMRIARVYAWVTFLLVINFWRHTPVSLMGALIKAVRHVFEALSLETDNAVDNMLALELDGIYELSDRKLLWVPMSFFPRLNRLHPYPVEA